MESISSPTSANRRARSTGTTLGNHRNLARAAKIVEAFNTWAFKREQPSDIALLKRFAMRACLCQEPLSFVLLTGKKDQVLQQSPTPDIQCLDYLSSLAARVKSHMTKAPSSA